MLKNFRFRNFYPSSTTEKVCAALMNKIFWKAPADSWIVAEVIRKNAKEYLTKIEIHSLHTHFLTEESGFSILQSVQKAANRTLGELFQWKKDRKLSDEDTP